MAINRYSKGANAERELLHSLSKQGFAIVRAAGSGTTPLPSPDLIALKGNKKLAFECKAWNSAYLHLDHRQMHELMDWAKIAKTDMYVAWKIPNQGWLFLEPKKFKKNTKNYSISKKHALKRAVRLDVILGKQAKLATQD